MKLGFVGLGKMGSRMASKLLMEDHDLIVWNRSKAPVEELQLKIQNSKVKIASQKLKVAETIEELVESLESPRVVWVMVTAGDVTQNVLNELSRFLEKDDIIIDGGNSYFKDTEKRSKDFKTKGIKFLGIGVSGGIIAFKNGYPLMAGGDKRAYEFIKPILDSLARPNGGHEYFGEGGAGHFVKMVHNGIEYGQMQAISEGFGVLDKAPYDFDLVKVAKLYQKGTLVSGFFMDRSVELLEQYPKLTKIVGEIGSATGETVWMIEQAKAENVPAENIQQALDFRKRSQTDTKIQKSFAARMVAGIRYVFGGHEVKRKF